ncbi:MAG: hypothetical protein UU54_C0010G0003 [Candidatus Yanofskybacteria bacterium GW2011_GWA2_41_22]|uniref:Ribosomal subunit interface protein n=3 Tax=Candidatus Yanofskyibacteriota TaxID=1752733 RepID=A0A1F8HQF4_9BACT|nr:MAG: hypothetical protein UU54_C0010G0003 [Candidatus Yanofskybacteria bacterium GW2011_GWA2_41_22]KKS27052.1 MAG: hypothetical protein UU84_C0011G0004 [Candidatus Yanofskybacteria bacterium GW2011_GWC2_41_9]OGN39817.1 MAG: hypothetical protein A2606_03510 [Candidatus Yanofskybacteria bacterium RIFOXYD1_FULL_42_10]
MGKNRSGFIPIYTLRNILERVRSFSFGLNWLEAEKNYCYHLIIMQIIISTKNITLDEALDVFVREKIGGLDHLIGNDKFEAKVEIGKPSLHHRSGEVFYAEVNLRIGGNLLRATCSHEDLRNAIVDVKEELQLQIKKFKEKRTDAARQPLEI